MIALTRVRHLPGVTLGFHAGEEIGARDRWERAPA